MRAFVLWFKSLEFRGVEVLCEGQGVCVFIAQAGVDATVAASRVTSPLAWALVFFATNFPEFRVY